MSELISDFHTKLLSLWNCGAPVRRDQLEELLCGMKKVILNSQLLNPNISSYNQSQIQLRDILEIAVQWTAMNYDIPTFFRYVTQLKTHYNEFRQLPQSPNFYHIHGLYLLALLTSPSEKMPIFHMELELLPDSAVEKNVYIRHVVLIERYLATGSYNKIMLCRSALPSNVYGPFLDLLIDKIRNEIISSINATKIPLDDALSMLFFKSEEELVGFNAGITVEDGFAYFKRKSERCPAFNSNWPNLCLLLIKYANTIEKII